MKRLLGLVLAAMTTVAAHADTVATLRNKAGGVIVLTDVTTDSCRGFVGAAYSTTSSNRTMWGCWFSDDLMVHIKWSDGDSTAYSVDVFDINEAVARRLRNRLKGPEGRTL